MGEKTRVNVTTLDVESTRFGAGRFHLVECNVCGPVGVTNAPSNIAAAAEHLAAHGVAVGERL